MQKAVDLHAALLGEVVAQKIAVPRWPDGGRRDEIWPFVRDWYSGQGFEIYEGHDPGPGEARNLAAQAAGDWDVLLFADADTLAHPDAIRTAIEGAHREDRMVICGDSHMYMSEASSNRILGGSEWFCRPADFTNNSIYAKPCSGVFAVPRRLYERIGGYPGVGPHGQEDQIWFELCRIFNGQVAWVADHITLHLWHPPARRDASTPEARRNYRIWQQLAKFRGPQAQEQARALLATVGHQIP